MGAPLEDKTTAQPSSSSSSSSSAAPPQQQPRRRERDSGSPEPEKVVRNGKLISKKKANLPFLKSHRWPTALPDKSAGKSTGKSTTMGIAAKEDSPPPVQRASEVSRTILRYSVVLVLGTLLLSRMVTETWTFGYQGKWTNLRNYIPMPPKTFTESELAMYDGSVPALPIYLALDGEVFDVSDNPRMYGAGGSYNHFAGKDAARAFVTGCFKSHATHDLRGLSEKEHETLDGWKKFFGNHAKYYKVGKVLHPPIDPASPLPPACNPRAEGGAR